MAFDIDDKTEQPTDRRRRLAREQGHGPRSAILTSACRLLGGTLALQFWGAGLIRECAQLIADGLRGPFASQLTIDTLTASIWEAIGRLAPAVLACLTGAIVGGLAAQLFQTGGRVRASGLVVDLNRLNPATGLGKISIWNNTRQATSAFTKYVLLLGVGGWSMWKFLPAAIAMSSGDAGSIALTCGASLIALAWQITGLFLVLGIADYAYQFWAFEQSLKMSPDEIREEARQQSGNPQWKQRRRELWGQQNVSSADTQRAGLDR